MAMVQAPNPTASRVCPAVTRVTADTANPTPRMAILTTNPFTAQPIGGGT